MTVKRIVLSLFGVTCVLVILKILELGAVVRWDWSYLFIPLFVGIGMLLVHLSIRAYATYTTLVTIINILYEDYNMRTTPLHTELLLEEETNGS
jgi:hypothetical protein